MNDGIFSLPRRPTLGKAPAWNGGFVAGRYYVGLSAGGLATVALSANVAYFIPYVVGEMHAFDRMAIQVTTAGTANNARLAIFTSLNGQPRSLIIDGGVVGGVNPLQSTGLKTVTIRQSLPPGIYWLAVVVDGTVTLQASGQSQAGLMAMTGTTDFVSADTNLNATLTFGPFSATAFAGGMGVATYTAASPPLLGLRA